MMESGDCKFSMTFQKKFHHQENGFIARTCIEQNDSIIKSSSSNLKLFFNAIINHFYYS